MVRWREEDVQWYDEWDEQTPPRPPFLPDQEPVHWSLRLLAWVAIVVIPWAFIISALAWIGVL